jgi:predicted nucleic acid-binding protein
MKRRLVLDTNVLVVANRQNSAVTERCIDQARECVANAAIRDTVCLDTDDQILAEYSRQINAEARPQDIAARLLIWLRQNQYNEKRIRLFDLKVNLAGDYTDCPIELITAGFDVSDRKFAAIAKKGKATVINATDSDWLDHSATLLRAGIDVDNLCGCDKANWFN